MRYKIHLFLYIVTRKKLISVLKILHAENLNWSKSDQLWEIFYFAVLFFISNFAVRIVYIFNLIKVVSSNPTGPGVLYTTLCDKVCQ